MAYALLPMIASGGMFGPYQRVEIRGFDLNLPSVVESMKGMEMELQDGCYPLLTRATFTTNDLEGFLEADYAILLGAFPSAGREKMEVLEKNAIIYRTMGNSLRMANPGCAVLVVGNPSCTNALVCQHYAQEHRMPKTSFFTLTRLDQNRATSQVAQRAAVNVSEVRNVVIWGGHAKMPDFDHTLIQGKPIQEVFALEEDRNWMTETVLQELQQRGAEFLKTKKSSAVISLARAICDSIHDLHFGTRHGQFVSMGVCSDGNEYGIPQGLYFSMPIQCLGLRRYRIASGLQLSEATAERIRALGAELNAERELVSQILQTHHQHGAANSGI